MMGRQSRYKVGRRGKGGERVASLFPSSEKRKKEKRTSSYVFLVIEKGNWARGKGQEKRKQELLPTTAEGGRSERVQGPPRTKGYLEEKEEQGEKREKGPTNIHFARLAREKRG